MPHNLHLFILGPLEAKGMQTLYKSELGLYSFLFCFSTHAKKLIATKESMCYLRVIIKQVSSTRSLNYVLFHFISFHLALCSGHFLMPWNILKNSLNFNGWLVLLQRVNHIWFNKPHHRNFDCSQLFTMQRSQRRTLLHVNFAHHQENQDFFIKRR